MLYRAIFLEYERMSKKILKYRENPPLNLVKKYENAVAELREHLYQNNIHMPIAKYPYDPEDKSTHAFIDNPKGPGSIRNPHYKYKDIWKKTDGVKRARL